MIIEIKVANYRSINEEQTLSFVADRASRHPGNLIKRPGYRLLKAVGMFGANASGKSNFVKAIEAMSAFIRDSATKMNDGDPIFAADPYRLDSATRNAPSRFEITFVTNGTTYTYGFTATYERVYEEWLRSKLEGKSKETTLIKRSISPDARSIYVTVDPSLESIMPLLLDRTRVNALMLSTAARENVKELLAPYRYIHDSLYTFYMSLDATGLAEQVTLSCQEDETIRQRLSSLLRDADIGIKTFRIENGRPTTYRSDNKGHLVKFDFLEDESEGTQQFFALMGALLWALADGDLIVVDEIDASMHPLLTRKLLELFQSPEANPNGAQLLFTTHDPSLLDQELFRRDQIWLAEKYKGASTFFSLADIEPPIRSTESFLRNYLTGRYGGTPHLGPSFNNILTGAEA